MTITCGNCKAENVANKGRGLCKTCYLAMYTSNRADRNWRLDRKRKTGVLTVPVARQDHDGPHAAQPRMGGTGQIAMTPSASGKDATVVVPFGGKDMGLYQRLVQEARFNRRTLSGQILFTLECELGTDRRACLTNADDGASAPA